MSHHVYYRGEITVSPPLREEHRDAVLAFSRLERIPLSEPIFERVAASQNPDLPWYAGLFDVSDDRSTILPDEDESEHGLRLWLVLLIEHYLGPLGYSLHGQVEWDNDADREDRGCIYVKDNLVEAVEDVICNSGPSWTTTHFADEGLKQVIRDLIDSSDDTGCTDDLTVVSSRHIQYLREAFPPD